MTSPSSATILIVEDEQIVAKDLQDTLADLGYGTSVIVSSADEAIAEASRRCPDLALMDIRIKGERDGVETAELLRRSFDVPVVFLTAHADDATLQRAKKTQPYGYLVKPVKSPALRSAIETALYRHGIEEQLRQRERWFSTVFRSIADAVIAVDLGGNITLLNPAAEFLIGRKLEEVAGLPAREVIQLLPAHAGEPQETALDRVLRERKQFHVPESTMMGPDNSTRIVSDSAAPVLDDEQVLGAVMVLRDVTEQKRLQSQLELSDRLASLGTMAAGVAHEINNPLAVVMANASLLLDDLRASNPSSATQSAGAFAQPTVKPEEMVEALTEINSAAGRIATIVRDLMTFARPVPRAGGEAEVRRAVDWAVRTTAHEFRDRARVVARVDDALLARIDEVRLGQVLVNLLVNAAQAIAPGHVAQNEVTISARTGPQGHVVLEMRDSGSGMPAEVQRRIFDPFFTTKPVGAGTGIGLSICRGMVRSAGGDIEVESTVGKGTLFRVILPSAARPEPATPTRVSI
jgi:PAS domain S-box-containing protein